MSARISIIAAIGKNRELGRKNELVWAISADLKRFKQLTTGHPIIMGRKTYESIGRPLPDRTNIVITRSLDPIPGCVVVHSIEEALQVANAEDEEEIFVIGGAEIFAQALPFTDRLYMTLVNAEDPTADVFFPAYPEFTHIIDQEEHTEHTPAYTWIALERPH
jgi:dihydrofolate reductase